MRRSIVEVFLSLICVINGEPWTYDETHARGLNKSDKVHECASDVVNNNAGEEFHWEYSKKAEINYFTSKSPVCWNAEKKVVIRKCHLETGTWIPENKVISCELIRKSNTFCPEDLIEIPVVNKSNKFLCIKKSKEPHEWHEKTCYGSDTVIHAMEKEEKESLSIYFKNNNIDYFWMPVSRSTVIKYSPFFIKLPGKQWGNIFEVDFISTRNKEFEQSQTWNCVIARMIGGAMRTKIVDCDRKYHSICLFEKYFISGSGCAQNFKSLSYRPNECYGINWEEQRISNELIPLTMAEYYDKRNIFKFFFKAIDIKRDQFFLLSGTQIDQEKFNLEMNVKEEFKITPRDEKTPTLSKGLLNERDKNVEMTLKLDAENGGLILTVYNRNYIWKVGDDEDNFGIKCFTNADYDFCSNVIIEEMIWENKRQTKSIFELEVHDNGPGYYWCEAHTVFNFGFVSTSMILATKKQRGHAFAVFVNVPCTNESCFSPHESFKTFAKNLKKTLNELKEDIKNKLVFQELKISDVRVMNIESMDMTNSTLRVLCHITVWKRSSSVDNNEQHSSEENDSGENELGIRHDTDIRLELRELLMMLLALESSQFSKTVNSTEFCFPQYFVMPNEESNQWYQAKYGQTSTTEKLCLQKNGLPVSRRCEGNFLYGAYWETFDVSTMLCITDTVESIITKNLYELDSSKLSKKAPQQVINNVKELLEENMNLLIPADFYYMGRIMQSVSRSLFENTHGVNNVNFTKAYIAESIENKTKVITDVVRIFNYLMKVNKNIVKPSAKLNSTNVLLDAFENFIDTTSMLEFTSQLENSFASFETTIAESTATSRKRIATNIIEDNDKHIERVEYDDVGVIVKITTELVIFTINPNIVNITGIAIFNSEVHSNEDSSDYGKLRGAFKDKFYRFVLANQSVSDILYEPGLQLATFVPETLWNRLDEISLLSNHTTTPKSDARIVLKLYSNDVLFQEERRTVNRKVFGRIISISMPGRDKDLPEMLPLIFRVNESPELNETQEICGYWNYKTWMSDGLVFLGRSDVDENLIVCGCTHLTPFAYLIGAKFNFSIDSEESEIIFISNIHKAALDIITLIGCSLSLFGVAGITITAIAFESWRRKASTKVLLQLSAAIALQMVLFCFVNTEEISFHLIENQVFTICIALGAALQYSVLVQFCWMAIIAYLQFKRYVRIFGNSRPKRFVIKSSLIGWGLPILPVFCVLLLDRDSYIPSYSVENGSICYPTGYSLYLGVVLPVLFVIVANLCIFLFIIYNVLRGPDVSIRHTEKKQVLSQLRLTFLLFFLLGFTWIFGLLNIMKAGISFSYLFCLTATLQGFVLFIYFIVLDPVTRRMWSGCLRRIFKMNRDFDTSNSMKVTTTTQ